MKIPLEHPYDTFVFQISDLAGMENSHRFFVFIDSYDAGSVNVTSGHDLAGTKVY